MSAGNWELVRVIVSGSWTKKGKTRKNGGGKKTNLNQAAK